MRQKIYITYLESHMISLCTASQKWLIYSQSICVRSSLLYVAYITHPLRFLLGKHKRITKKAKEMKRDRIREKRHQGKGRRGRHRGWEERRLDGARGKEANGREGKRDENTTIHYIAGKSHTSLKFYVDFYLNKNLMQKH